MRRGLISGEIGGKMVHPRREECIIRLGLPEVTIPLKSSNTFHYLRVCWVIGAFGNKVSTPQ